MTGVQTCALPICFPVTIRVNLFVESFFFFVPNRLVWNNFVKMMGEQDNPADSISYVTHKLTSAAGGFPILTIYDYMGLPTVGQVGGANTITVQSLPLRSYNLIWNQWFRDQNLQTSVLVSKGDGPDAVGDFTLLRRGKRHDYFTSCLPSPQKGLPVSMPLGTTAPVKSDGTAFSVRAGTGAMTLTNAGTGAAGQAWAIASATGASGGLNWGASGAATTGLYADLTAATAATINQLRQSFQIQRLLERDMRGGSRYIESVFNHFGVRSDDARLDRPEYLGGGISAVNINPIAQNAQTGLTGGSTPLGTLGAMGVALGRGHGFQVSIKEHGHILGLVSVRADLTYQQGLRKMWSRDSRYDFYYPVFAHLGEQAVLLKEIYADGSAADNNVFGYQERWGEYRYNPSQITGLFRSTSAGMIDSWHLAQRFTVAPTLNATFIQDTPPMSRVLAVGAGANGQQFICDAFFDCKFARAMPMYSVPGLIDHF